LNKKLYYKDQYINECTSIVEDIRKKDGKILIILDNSPFYPTGGGQPNDLGKIDSSIVLDVFEQNGIVYNEVDIAPEKQDVKCNIDFYRRFDFMQQHTGEHLLSAAFLKKYEGVNKGFHLGEEYTTIDIDLPEVTAEMISSVELEANNYIYENLNIDTYFVDRTAALDLPLRSKIKVIDTEIRIVNIPGVDMCACCGTHVKRTGEVGIIKIIKVEKHKGMCRIFFKCGKRALEDYNTKQNIISQLVKTSASEESKLAERFNYQNEKILELTKNLLIYKKKSAITEATTLLLNVEKEIIFKKYTDKNFEEVQMIAEEIIKNNRVFVGVSELDKKILLCHNGCLNINCGNIFKSKLKEYGGKGGGDTKRAQGTFISLDELKIFTDEILKLVRVTI